MILVTGASGKTGQAVVQAMAAHGMAIRALVRSPQQVSRMRALGAAEVVVGDMRTSDTWKEALLAARAVYHICPNMAPDEIAIGETALHASRTAGITHFVYHSVLHPHIEEMPHHWHKMRVEERIFTSHLPFTILQPSAYMQNVLATWETIVSQGRFQVPYRTATRLSLVDLADVAAVAVTVLTQPGHMGSIYELSGPAALTQQEVAASLGHALGRPVVAETLDMQRWELGARQKGIDSFAMDTLRAMFRYYERHGLHGGPHVLASLLGRPPTSFDDFIQRTIRYRERI